MKADFQIQPFKARGATLKDYAALNRIINRIRLERLPNDPPMPMQELVQQMRNLPDFVDLQMWCIWDESHTEIIAHGNVGLMQMKENRHLAQFDIIVQKEVRRQGLGRQLLTLVVEACQIDNRRLLIVDTSNRIPGGEAFLNRIGGQKGLVGHVNQLKLSDLDRSLVDRWLAQGQENSEEFELGVWEGSYPEEQLTEIAHLLDLINQQPLGDLEIEDMHISPEQLRQIEKMDTARGNKRTTFYLMEKATGKFAGYTETIWNANRPEILRQDMTGVYPEYRGKGLGRWLKAAMLDRAMRERPEIKYVRTQNADMNAAMLKINNELGFQPYNAITTWQIDIDKVLDYLKDHQKKEIRNG
jgi:mycothiol synthase